MKNKYAAKKRWYRFVATAAIVLIAVGAVFVLELTNRTHIFHKKPLTSSVIPAKSPNNGSDNSEEEAPDNRASEAPATDKNTATPSSGTELLAPSGNFISSHIISPQNPQAVNQESICITTPGASCRIEFKMGTIVKSLESRIADSSGAVVWRWNLKDAGLTEGTWQIIATAQLGNETKTTLDTMNLEVQP